LNDLVGEWLVVFFRQSQSWYGKYVPGEFKHVALLRFYPATNSWLYLDMDFKGIHAVSFGGDEASMTPFANMLGRCAVLKVAIGKRRFTVRGFMTCVQFVKHAIGYRNWRAFTPDQLYDALIDAGADHLKS